MGAIVHPDDAQDRPCVACSVHSAAVSADVVMKEISQMQGILEKRFASRQCVASAANTWLQDGVYIPWKKPSSKYNMMQLVKFNRFAGIIPYA